MAIKFNGMLFTAQQPYDQRQWGPNNWYQNMRLPYYSLPAQVSPSRPELICRLACFILFWSF